MFKKKDKVTKYWLDKLECEYDLHVTKLNEYLLPYKILHQGGYDEDWYERKYFYDCENKSLKAFRTLQEIVEWAEKHRKVINNYGLQTFIYNEKRPTYGGR